MRSLKKAAPLLVHVAFLIGFFWLLFAIIGVQSFKASLRRTCTFTDLNVTYIQNTSSGQVQFCGGYLNSTTGEAMPWLSSNRTSYPRASHKGYLCPQGSLCIEGNNPYNGTMSFDNVPQALQLVFVIMSANTFSDLLYYTTQSDHLAAALCQFPARPYLRPASLTSHSLRVRYCDHDFLANEFGIVHIIVWRS